MLGIIENFIAEYGQFILMIVMIIAYIATAIYTLIRVFNIGKKVDNNIVNTDEKIKITQNGIVEAFKTAKLPTDWKISVSNQVDKKLTEWGNKTFAALEAFETIRTQSALLCLKILGNTAAFNKLTDEEKSEITDLLKMITEEDSTIDINAD